MVGEKNIILYDDIGLSVFCLQISLLLNSAVPIGMGLDIMAEDATDNHEAKILKEMANETESGELFSKVLKKTGAFPLYMITMVEIGEQTGNLDTLLLGLSQYYKKKDKMTEQLKSAITYPSMLVMMLLVVMYILFDKVMPIFENVYQQLGLSISPILKSVISVGSVISGLSIIVLLVLIVTGVILYLLGKKGIHFRVLSLISEVLINKSKILTYIAKQKFAFVIAISIKSGIQIEQTFKLAKELADNREICNKLKKCSKQAEFGDGYYEILKEADIFTRFNIQMIKVGTKSGHLDEIMEQIADDYDNKAHKAFDSLISGFEPIVVAVLAVCVGMVLLSVMLPLAGILSSIA